MSSHAATVDEAQDGHEKGYEPDVKSSEMTTLGIYFVLLAGLFFTTLAGLYMYFRYEAAQHIEATIGAAPTVELDKARAAAKTSLSNIDDAMKAVAAESQKK
jgi:hypothetical protein